MRCFALFLLLLLERSAAKDVESGPRLKPPLINLAGRESLLKEAQASMRRDSPHAEWYSKKGEQMLKELLARLPSDDDDQSTPPVGRRGGTEGLDLDALWLLCRSSMGAIEAALQELGQAQGRVERLRWRWRSISSGSPSLAVNYFVYGRYKSLLRALRLGGHSTVTPPHLRRNYDYAPLGSGRTRLGLGIRRRALLRSEQALACHAGALHDLRVLLRDVGGEWLELGRWVGGPPLASMPWDSEMCKDQQKELLAACGRVLAQMRATADALQAHGAYAMYAAPLPAGAKELQPLPIGVSRSSLTTATRQMLSSLVSIRVAARRQQAPRPLMPPGHLQRHSLLWLGLIVLLSYGYMHWLPTLWPMRHEAMRVSAKAAADLARFWDTHVTEPLRGIAQELFHGHEPTIDPAQVRETRESLVRMLQDFVRDSHGVAPWSSSSTSLEEALEKVADGSMGVVTSAFEEQVRSPVSNLFSGKLLRSLLLIMQQLRLLMEEEVAAVDSLLKRNDFNLQVMATVPAFGMLTLILMAVRSFWRRLRGSDAARRDPIEAIQAEVIAIDSLLTRAEGDHTIRHGLRPPAFQRGALSQFEASPMALSEVGELVFRIQRLRELGSTWLRGLLRAELMHDAQVLLDSGRLSAEQRARVARSLMRRLDNINLLRDAW